MAVPACAGPATGSRDGDELARVVDPDDGRPVEVEDRRTGRARPGARGVLDDRRVGELDGVITQGDLLEVPVGMADDRHRVAATGRLPPEFQRGASELHAGDLDDGESRVSFA